MKAAAYLRVSSQQQADADRWGYHRQHQAVSAYADRNDLRIVEEYRDAITGTSITRFALEKLKREAEAFNAVIISSVDRLARDVQVSYQVLSELLDAGLEVHSADFGKIDLDDDATFFQFHIQSGLSDMERRRIIRRTQAALVAMAEAGKLPNGIKTFGYRSNGEGGAEIVPEQAAIVRRIYRMRARGSTFRTIMRTLNDENVPVPRPGKNSSAMWWFSAVRGLVSNPAYKGEYRWRRGNRKYTIKIPSIVSTDLWEAAQSDRVGTPSSTGWPLIGHLRSGTCGKRMHAKKDRKPNKTYEYYRCQSESEPTGSCGQKNIRRADLEQSAEAAIREHLTDPGNLERLFASSPREEKEDPRLIDLRREHSLLLVAYRKELLSLDEFAAARSEIEDEIAALQLPAEPTGPGLQWIAEAAIVSPIGEFLAAAGIVVIASQDSIRFEFK